MFSPRQYINLLINFKQIAVLARAASRFSSTKCLIYEFRAFRGMNGSCQAIKLRGFAVPPGPL